MQPSNGERIMANPIIPRDINSAEPALRSEFISYIEQLIDAAQPATRPSENNDLLKGNANVNSINGRSGNDVIFAYGGNDSILGNFGNDYIQGMDGDDTLDGGDGNDFLFGGLGIDSLNGRDGDDAMFGGDGNDDLTGENGNDWLYGNAGHDVMNGGEGNDILDGDAGRDTLNGGTDNDELHGDGGADILKGQDGNDFIEGGAGADNLSGGADDDIYYYASTAHGRDRILDFNTDQDQFHFKASAFGVEGGYNVVEGLTFIANNNPFAQTDDATVLYETDTGRLYFDGDGTGAGAAVLIATIKGAPSVGDDDIIFV
jgi:Ca2+-binding RTX toxin-like protein